MRKAVCMCVRVHVCVCGAVSRQASLRTTGLSMATGHSRESGRHKVGLEWPQEPLEPPAQVKECDLYLKGNMPNERV